MIHRQSPLVQYRSTRDCQLRKHPKVLRNHLMTCSVCWMPRWNMQGAPQCQLGVMLRKMHQLSLPKVGMFNYQPYTRDRSLLNEWKTHQKYPKPYLQGHNRALAYMQTEDLKTLQKLSTAGSNKCCHGVLLWALSKAKRVLRRGNASQRQASCSEAFGFDD
eukprot:1598405-Amphidinium_carterae.1